MKPRRNEWRFPRGEWPGTVYWMPPPPPPADPDPPEYEQPDRTGVALVLAVISLVVAPLGVVAWAVASACLRAIAAGRMDPAGEPNAKFARVLGIIATCMFLVKLLVFAAVFFATS